VRELDWSDSRGHGQQLWVARRDRGDRAGRLVSRRATSFRQYERNDDDDGDREQERQLDSKSVLHEN